MADATIALYATALVTAKRGAPAQPFDARRVRDARGYAPWHPPSRAPGPALAAAEPPAGWPTRIARSALAIRHTVVGRALYRVAPRPLLEALKARLHA
jgi:hypothetical protein